MTSGHCKIYPQRSIITRHAVSFFGILRVVALSFPQFGWWNRPSWYHSVTSLNPFSTSWSFRHAVERRQCKVLHKNQENTPPSCLWIAKLLEDSALPTNSFGMSRLTTFSLRLALLFSCWTSGGFSVVYGLGQVSSAAALELNGLNFLKG